MALSKKDLQINITMNELYNTQSLLIQHIDVLVSPALRTASFEQQSDMALAGTKRQSASAYTAGRSRLGASPGTEKGESSGGTSAV